MKAILSSFFLIISISIFSQISFRTVVTTLPEAKTDFETADIGDINNDGLKDLVIGSGYYFDDTNDYSIIIYKQAQDGNLSSPTMFKYPKAYPGLKVLKISDLNNDKLNDIVIGYSDSIGIYYQLKSGGFSKINSFFSGHSVDGLKTGDLNNDGLTDIAVCHWNDPFIKIFTQKTDGSFSTKAVAIKNAGYDEIDIADVNGDNLNDIIYMPGQLTHSTLQILYQKPNIGITDSVFLYKYPGEYYPTFNGIGIGDLNNDGRNDIVGAMGGNTANMILMLQDSLGKMGNKNLKISAYDIPTPVEVADLNCDGNNEIIVGHDGWNAVTIYEKNALQEYDNYSRYGASYNQNKYSMAVGDLNNDNKIDIVSVTDNATFTILYNTSKPKSFNKIDTTILNLTVMIDTTSNSVYMTTIINDPSPTCKVNRELLEKITIKSRNEYFTGDSLLIRHSNLCNYNYIDTIMTHFSYTKSTILSIDTTKTIINNDYCYVSSENLTVSSANNSSCPFYIYSNICWNLSIDQNWLVASKASGSGSSKIYLTATENQSTNPRTAIITLTALGVPTIKIAVIQQGASPFIESSASSIILSENVNNTSYFNINSNISWKISLDTTWLKANKYEGVGNSLITINATSNKLNSNKYGIITIIGADTIIKTIGITQLSNNTNSLPQNTNDIPNINIYPNPIKNKLHIENQAMLADSLLEIYDLNGMLQFKQELNTKDSEFDINFLTKGVYLLKLHTVKGVMIKKIIKE